MKDTRLAIAPGSVVTVLLIIAGAYVLWLLRDLALLVLTAIVIASAIEPGIAFFIRRRIPRFFSTLLMYVLVLGSVFSLIYFFFPPIIADIASFLSDAPQYLNTLSAPASFSGIANATDLLGSQYQAQSVLNSILSLQSAFSATGGGVIQLLATFFGGIFSLLLVIVLSFYFALQDTGVDDFLRLVVPSKHEEYAVDLWKRSQKKIGRWMQGQILLSVIVGVLVYIGLLIIGIPYALLLAVFTALVELIPIFGSLTAGAVAAIIAFSTGGFPLALIVVGLYVVVNQFEANLIYPLIVKKVIGVPPLMVIVALIAGGTLAGFLGVLLSVPVAAVALELLSDFEKRKRRAVHP
ncbi:MAG: AI-2E family transporter [bacterium]|nr:AI-2E family transporter [bacterium]